jgi:hypothetical protein
MLRKPRQRAQALTEFLFVMPLVLLVSLSVVQLVIVMDRNQKTQMGTWMAIRSQGYDSSHSHVSRSDAQSAIQGMFGPGDQVSVDFHTGESIVDMAQIPNPEMFAEEIYATVTCKTPYLFGGISSWPSLSYVFESVESDGSIQVSSKNQMMINAE